MIRDTLLLLHLQYLVFKGSLKTSKKTSLLMGCLGVLTTVAFAAFSTVVGIAAATMVWSLRGLGNLEWIGPALLLTLAVFLFSISGFINAMSGLYLSGDLDLLMAAPVDRRAIFISKMLRGMGTSYGLLTILAVPALIAYGVTLKFGVLYYVLGLIALSGVPLFGAAFGALATMLVARFAPAGRVREAISAFASLLGLAFYVVMRLWDVLIRGGNGQKAPNVLEMSSSLQGLLNAPIPTYWAGRALAAAGHNDLGASLVQLAVYLLLTFGLFVFTVIVANQLYAVGWLRIQGGGIAKRKRITMQRPGLLAHLPLDFAFFSKDWRLRIRDLRLIVQMLSSIVFLIVWAFLFVYRPNPKQAANTDRVFSSLSESVGGFDSALLAAGILLIGIMMLDSVVSTSMSMEGRNLWILKIAPVRGWHIIRGKLATVSLPFIALTTILLVALSAIRHMHPLWSVYAWLCIQLLGLTMLCLGICLSLPWAKLDWDDPKQMHAGAGGCIYWIERLVYGVPAALLLCVPLLLARAAPEQLMLFIGLALSISTLWSLLFVGVTAAYACRAWKRLGEPTNARAKLKEKRKPFWLPSRVGTRPSQ